MTFKNSGLLVSLAICAHNPRKDYFERLLTALRDQTMPYDKWELLIIDNLSDRPLADEYDVSWHPHARWLRETELGVLNARLCAIKNARADLIIFFDDDNVPAADYIALSHRIHEEYPEVGTFGAGEIVPEFEITPPAWIKGFLGYLALRTVKEASIFNSPRGGYRPWGAGQCVTGEVAQAYSSYIAQNQLLTYMNRRGSESLVKCDDDLFSLAAIKIGKPYGLFPGLKVLHLIDKKRLSHSYFKRLVYGNSYSHAILALISSQSLDNPFKPASGKLALYYLIHLKPRSFMRELKRLLFQCMQSGEVKSLMRERYLGWEDAVTECGPKE